MTGLRLQKKVRGLKFGERREGLESNSRSGTSRWNDSVLPGAKDEERSRETLEFGRNVHAQGGCNSEGDDVAAHARDGAASRIAENAVAARQKETDERRRRGAAPDESWHSTQTFRKRCLNEASAQDDGRNPWALIGDEKSQWT